MQGSWERARPASPGGGRCQGCVTWVGVAGPSPIGSVTGAVRFLNPSAGFSPKTPEFSSREGWQGEAVLSGHGFALWWPPCGVTSLPQQRHFGP